ncbi:serpin-Z7-like [Papaver somniferum]|uniref:serpin-Z7-like n=1 Tax=Papaver somniferum TaxID=3469 RepID=UPI000E6F5C3D|nr:serpin-Z7-like [Papaver somniferum]
MPLFDFGCSDFKEEFKQTSDMAVHINNKLAWDIIRWYHNFAAAKAFMRAAQAYTMDGYRRAMLEVKKYKGATLKQLLAFLKSDSLDHLNSVSSQLIDSFDQSRIDGGPKISIANGVWVENTCSSKPSFKEVASSVYRAGAEAVDFQNKAKEITDMVNKWVENETNGLIQNLIPGDAIREDTSLVLVNALYFKGSWKKKFDPSKTIHSNFYLSYKISSSVMVPFMTDNKEIILFLVIPVSKFHGVGEDEREVGISQLVSEDPKVSIAKPSSSKPIVGIGMKLGMKPNGTEFPPLKANREEMVSDLAKNHVDPVIEDVDEHVMQRSLPFLQ